MAGQLGHFTNYAPEKIGYALNRYGDEYNRLLGVIDKQLAGRDYLCGDYSIADMASWPWVVVHERINQSLDEFPRVKAWDARMQARPAVAAGKDLGKELRRPLEKDEEARRIMFGQTGGVGGRGCGEVGAVKPSPVLWWAGDNQTVFVFIHALYRKLPALYDQAAIQQFRFQPIGQHLGEFPPGKMLTWRAAAWATAAETACRISTRRR